MDRLGFNLELKAVQDSGAFQGRAAVYGNVDAYGDRIVPGAFTESLQKRGDVRPLLWTHDVGDVLGTCKLSDAADGLNLAGTLDMNVGRAKEVHSLMKSGAVSGLSIGFTIPSGGTEMDGSVRVLKKVDLREVSLTALPANDQATVTQVKSIRTMRDFERFLHQQGWSKREAAVLATGGWKALQTDTPESELLEWLRETNAVH
jgi:Escherichia/Staphylococcus phage prohead protease